jgi:hypothetical protein
MVMDRFEKQSRGGPTRPGSVKLFELTSSYVAMLVLIASAKVLNEAYLASFRS